MTKREKKDTVSAVSTNKDELIESIYNIINTNETYAYNLGIDGMYAPTDVVDWVSTGNKIMDMIISNRENGGIPVGRITEITGLESSSKSLLVNHILAETQKKNGIGVLIDTEQAADRAFMTSVGVNLDKLIYVDCNILEDIFLIIENIIETIRKSDADKLVTIAVDSIMGSTTKIENVAEYEKDGYATQKAIILSKAMRKMNNIIGRYNISLIFTNQLRTRLNVQFGDPWCVDPHTTKVKIHYKLINNWIEDEITLTELASKFYNINNFENKNVLFNINTQYKNLQILSKNLKTKKNEWKNILSFVVKNPVHNYFTDGNLKVSSEHSFIDNNDNKIKAYNHPNFKKEEGTINIVDIEVEDNHNYYANGYLHSNTTSGGKAIGFHSSLRLRLKNISKIKDKNNTVIGLKNICTVIKSRIGPPFRSCEFEIYFDRGMDEEKTWFDAAKTAKLIIPAYKIDDNGKKEKIGGWSMIKDGNPEKRFQSTSFKQIILNDPEQKQFLLDLLKDYYIMEYADQNNLKSIDETEIEYSDLTED